MIVGPHRPNTVEDVEKTNSSVWGVIATDMSVYASIALLLAAGKTLWPGMFAGKTGTTLKLRTRTSANAAGGAFYYALNRPDAGFADLANDTARDDDAEFATGNVEGIMEEGPIYCVWRRKVVATDYLVPTLKG